MGIFRSPCSSLLPTSSGTGSAKCAPWRWKSTVAPMPRPINELKAIDAAPALPEITCTTDELELGISEPSVSLTVGVACAGCGWVCSFDRSYCVKAVPAETVLRAAEDLEVLAGLPPAAGTVHRPPSTAA